MDYAVVHEKRHAWLPFIILLFVAILIGLAALFFHTSNSVTQNQGGLYTGTINFSGIKKGESAIRAYQIQLPANEIYNTLPGITGVSEAHPLGPDMQFGVMTNYVHQDNINISDDITPNIGEFYDAISLFQKQDEGDYQITPLTWSGQFERQINIDQQSNSVLFIQQDAQNALLTPEGFSNIGNWNISHLDLGTGETTVIDNGVSPIWAESGKSFLYLFKEGLAIHDIESNTSTPLLGMYEGRTIPYNLNQKIAISPDKRIVVMTAPGINKTFLYNFTLSDDGEAAIELERTIELPIGVGHYEPVFSPDGNHLAVIQTTYASPNYTELEQVVMRIYNLIDLTTVNEINLNDFEFTSLFSSAWY